MELTPLRYFKAIASHGHLTRAARALGVTQPALSAMLKKLEGEVGAELLHRTGRGVELTEAGRTFLAYAEGALRSAEQGVKAVRELAGLERGSIRVGGGATATTYILPRVVSQVRGMHPGLRFYVREAGSSAVANAVASGELDLGIVTLPVPTSLRGELVALPLVDDELRLITPKGYVLREVPEPGTTRSGTNRRPAGPRVTSPRSFHWKQLDGESLVAFEAGTAVREMIDRAAAAAGASMNIVMELRSIESIKSMVAAGIGVGFVSRFALDGGGGLACAEGSLVRKLAIVRRSAPGLALGKGAALFERELVRAMRGA